MKKQLFLACIAVLASWSSFGFRLVVKLKPEAAEALHAQDGTLRKYFQQLGLPIPAKMFPGHFSPRIQKTALGKELVDLSLLYVTEIPEPFETGFLLKLLNQRPEIAYAEWDPQDARPLTNPNDPNADSLLGSQRQVLRKIEAYKAWGITQGDTSVLVGILDTGIPVGHEDIQGQVQKNYSDPPNGVDDDQNGLVDDYLGWDFGSNDNNPDPDNTGTIPGHGTSVAGIAGAGWNNGKGIAGIAAKCRILPLKIWKWNNSFSNFRGYEAIVYAADRGCKVINCSWGSARNNRQFEQDIINYATFNKDALVVAAGGNSPGFFNFLPANYDNVLGVTMTDTTDRIFWAASVNYKLDLAAPGVQVFGIQTNGNYGWVEGGSSMAAPQVAGAAALVRARYPELSGIQAGEILRVNTDSIYGIPGNASYRGLAGKGRLNIWKALQKIQSVSLRPVEIRVKNKYGRAAQAGDSLRVQIRMENYLDPVPSYSVNVFSSDTLLKILTPSLTFQNIGTMVNKWLEIPFQAIVSSGLIAAKEVPVRVKVMAGNYQDERWFFVRLDNQMIRLDTNSVDVTIPANGRLGYGDISNTAGAGIQFKGVQYCGDAGLMIGTGPGKVSNCVYDTAFNDVHFRAVNRIRFAPWPETDEHAVVHMNDSGAGSNAVGLDIKASFFESASGPLSGTAFCNYHIRTKNTQILDSLCVGMYTDWEVENLNANFVNWIDSLRLGYTQGKAFRHRFAGTQILNPGEPQFYAIDALPNTQNGNINLFDGFSIAEKWKTISSGIGRSTAGQGNIGNNVVQVTGIKLRNIEPGGSRKVSFALVFADSLPELILKARANLSYFRQQNISPSPGPQVVKFCEGDTARIPITGPWGQLAAVFGDSLATVPLTTQDSLITSFYSDSTLFVAGMDSLYPGPRARISAFEFPRPGSQFEFQSILPGDSVFTDSTFWVQAADTSSQWKRRWFLNGTQLSDTTFRIGLQIDSSGDFNICLEQTGRILGCPDTTCRNLTVFDVVSRSPGLSRPDFRLYPNPASNELRIESPVPINLICLNMLGQKVGESRIEAGYHLWETKNLPPGWYYFLLSWKDGQKTFPVRIR